MMVAQLAIAEPAIAERQLRKQGKGAVLNGEKAIAETGSWEMRQMRQR